MADCYEIDGIKLYHFVISGANYLIHNESMLNRINVFPVPDGDTGTNLSLTMKSIINKSEKNAMVSKTLASISQTALENAYGNSGMIFAQYLNGLSIEAKQKNKLTIHEFAEIAKNAANHAFHAVAAPKDGTILTVMKEWAAALSSNVHLTNFEKIFEKSVQRAKQIVEETKYKMKVFMEYNVVDAGAKGFLFFLEGILDFIKNGESTMLARPRIDFDENHVNVTTNAEVIQNRYCSQFTIQTDKTPEYFFNALANMGDSLVITKSEQYLQIHIHTDVPDQVMAQFGKEDLVQSHKVEDMSIQSAIKHNRLHNIALVTDSIADLPRQMIRENQVTVIPVHLICDSRVYLDKLTMTPQLFYQQLDSFQMNPTSAQPTIAAFEQAYSYLLDSFDSVIGIFVSSQMSGIYNNAMRAAESFKKSGKKISVIDSKLNSAAEGILVTEAIDLINAGWDHERIVEHLNRVKQDISIYVSVSDLSSMIRGGRVSKVTGFVLKRIKLKPVISIDQSGKGLIFKKSLTQKQALRCMIKQIAKDFQTGGIQKYGLVYSDSRDLVTEIQNKMQRITKQKPLFVESISPVVGLNSGKGSFAVAYLKGRQVDTQ